MGQMRPILILTPGCAGSSKIADILWRRHGVVFTHQDPGRITRDGKPFHEDPVMKKATENLVLGRIMASTWLDLLEREALGGVKNLHLAFLKQSQLNEINPRLVIETVRDKTALAESWSGYGTWDWRGAMESIERLDWDPWATVDMTRHRPDHELENFSDGWMRMATASEASGDD